MSSTYHCGDHEGLVAYVYDECEPMARDAIAAHVSTCAGCAEEVAALSGTRRLLAAWTPPETTLGWRIEGGHPARAGSGSRTAGTIPWWRQPLPAWAQVAAALLIFAAGLAAGTRAVPAPDPARASSVARAVSAPDSPDVTGIERRLAALEASARENQQRLAALGPERPDAAALMRQVRSEIETSEDRMRREVAMGLLWLKAEEAQVAEDLTNDVQALRAFMTQRVGFLQP